jgi:DNA-binding beta-propeller fold protein YncE
VRNKTFPAFLNISVIAALLLLPACLLNAQEAPSPFLPGPVRAVSTIPANGDLNPYGVAFVPAHFPAGGTINPGDVLVSNFNNSANLQGTGTTIITVPTNGPAGVFYQGPSGLGLSTGLAVLNEGLVVVGNFPTADGSCATGQAGSLLVLDSSGNLLSTYTSSAIDGPWDLTVNEGRRGEVQIFVSNALNGTVTRLDASASASGLTVHQATRIASGYMHRCDPAALVVAPTGLVFDASHDVLYVASTDDNAVFAVPGAGKATQDGGTGRAIYRDKAHLHGPNGMALAPNGDLLAAQSDAINSDPSQPSEIVEFTTDGHFVKQISMDPAQGGAFGLAVSTTGHTARFAAVDDGANTLVIWTVPLP